VDVRFRSLGAVVRIEPRSRSRSRRVFKAICGLLHNRIAILMMANFLRDYLSME
jgi:hypothetical protein